MLPPLKFLGKRRKTFHAKPRTSHSFHWSGWYQYLTALYKLLETVPEEAFFSIGKLSFQETIIL